MYFERRRNKPLVIALITIMILTSMLPFMTDTAAAFSGKKGSTYYTSDGGRIEYGPGDGGYSNTRKTDLDDSIGTRYAYCVQPAKVSPVVGKMTVDKVVTDENETGKWNALRNIVYYSPSYPGYENNVKNIQGASYYNGNFTHDWAVAHLAMSYVYEKKPSDLDTFNGTKASDLGELWTSAKAMGDALWKSDSSKDEAVPDNFKVFISFQEHAQDVIVGYLEAPGKLTLKKSSNLTKISDDNNMYDFAGAVYTVYDENGDEAGTLTTDSDGNSGELELIEGTYTVKETTAPYGYAKDTETYTVEVESEKESTFKPKETPITAKIDVLLEKRGKGYDHNYGEGDASLKGAIYKVEYYDSETAPGEAVLRAAKKAKATWYFVTDDKGEIKGANPKTSGDYDNSALYKDADGNVVFPLGSYVIKEVKAPIGYLIDTEEIIVHVNEDGTDKAYTKAYNTATSYEEIMRGGVKVAKIDHTRANNIPQGDATLAGAEFTVINRSAHSVMVNGKEYGANKAVLTIITDENGIAASDTNILPYGSYSISETKAPAGYLLNEIWEQTFEIRENGQIIDLTDKKIDDSVKLGGVRIFKIDNDLETAEAQGDATLEMAEFTVTNKSGRSVIVNGTEFQTNDVVMTISTDASGAAETGNILPYGTYSIKETVPSEGYLINTKWEEIVEVRGHNTTVELADKPAKEAVQRGGVRISKIDSQLQEAYAQGDSTLEGAEFTIYNKSKGVVFVDGKEYRPDEACKVITTDKNGIAEAAKDSLPYGTYSIRETKPSEGYLLNEVWEKTFEIREDGQMIDLTEDRVEELVKRSGIQIQKRDIELGKSEAMGGATLEGIVMTIRNVSDHDVVVRSDIGSDETVDWTDSASMKELFETEIVKRVIPNEDVGKITVHWNAEKNAYTAETLADDLPYGTYTIRESKTNDCYQRTDKAEHKLEVREDGSVYSYDDHVEILSFDDHVYRSDIQGTKIGDSTSERFSYVPFKIISVSTGETHVVVADKNGFFSTKDRRTADMLEEDEDADNVRKINPFDDLMGAETITSKMIEERKDEILMGNWFGTGEFGSKAEPNFKLGALPYDSYILEEMSCEKNEGYTLQRFFFTVDEKSLNGFVDLETITDDVPEIGTTAAVNGKNTDVKTDKEITLIDTVEYTNLLRGETYTVKGKLIDKATGEVVKDAAGNEVIAETTFKPWMGHGKVKVKFVFDGSNMYDMDTVVFETVYDSNGHVIAKHDDINDEGQTVTWEKLEPGYEMYKVRTTKAPKKGEQFGFHALDEVTYDVYVENTGNIALTMDVTDQFTENPEYFTEPVVRSVKFDGAGTWNNEGDEHTANITLNRDETAVITFTANILDDAVEYLANDKYDSDSKDSRGKDTNLAYQFNETDDKDGYINTAKSENVTYPDPKNPEEPKILEPKEDVSQTPVQKPAIGTTLADEFGKKEIVTGEKTVLVDTVYYEGLDTSKWYVIEGTLILKDTGDPLVENGEEITVMSEAFRPSRANGFVEILFEINTSGLEGKELVAFETVYRINDYTKGMDLEKADKVVVAEHKDINDEGQTIKLIKPEEPETPKNPDEPTTPSPKRTDHPKTGDPTNLIIPALLLAGSAAGLTVVIRRRKKH